MFDVFSGSGIVARSFKQYASLLLVNDQEYYSDIINRCYLSNRSELNMPLLKDIYIDLTTRYRDDESLSSGAITQYYAPAKDDNIQKGERVFYTHRNAQYIDTLRKAINGIDERHQPYFIAPLLYEASVHSNTSGVFKGFYKNKTTGIGQFGGTGQDALHRIKGKMALPFPVFSNMECEYKVYSGDANKVIGKAQEVDLAYIDPPYNQHPYGSNYFMLNLIAHNTSPQCISPVSGIVQGWNRSAYNKKAFAISALSDLISRIKASHVLVSYNSEGFISLDEMMTLLNAIGKVEVLQTQYNTFRGCRNLAERDIHVTEYLFLLEKRNVA